MGIAARHAHRRRERKRTSGRSAVTREREAGRHYGRARRGSSRAETPAVGGAIYRQPAAEHVASLLESAGLPGDDLSAAMLADFFACGDRNAPVGVVGLELYGSEALLRSLVVRDSERGRGAGRALIAAAETHARDAGVCSVYLLTETASAFFSSLGYRTVARERAPQAIRATAQFATLCPDSAELMCKVLAPRPGLPADPRSP